MNTKSIFLGEKTTGYEEHIKGTLINVSSTRRIGVFTKAKLNVRINKNTWENSEMKFPNWLIFLC